MKTYHNLLHWKKKDILALPHKKWDFQDTFDSLIIIPEEDLHDSGFRCMSFALVKDFEPYCIVSGCSDVVDIEGIGGYGYDFEKTIRTGKIDIRGWKIDCLPCGYLRLFNNSKMQNGTALSNFTVYGVDRNVK